MQTTAKAVADKKMIGLWKKLVNSLGLQKCTNSADYSTDLYRHAAKEVKPKKDKVLCPVCLNIVEISKRATFYGYFGNIFLLECRHGEIRIDLEKNVSWWKEKDLEQEKKWSQWSFLEPLAGEFKETHGLWELLEPEKSKGTPYVFIKVME